MNSSLQQMFTPRSKRRAKTWDPETHAGLLWIWTGKFKRWKRREFSAAHPGLLKYRGRERRGKFKTGSINLSGAALEISAADSRLLILRSQHLGKIYLRTTDPADQAPCAESIERSITTFGTLLSRASAVLGVPPQEGELLLKSSSSNRAVGEPLVAREINDRIRTRLKAIHPLRDAFEAQLADVRARLEAVSAALDLGGSRKKLDVGAEAAHRKDGYGREPAAPDLHHVDSFQSALSDLQRSPSRSGEDGPFDRAGPFADAPLDRAWRAYGDAVEAAVRSDAIRIVELQAENEALKTAMRNFKNRAVAMRADASRAESGKLSLDRLNSSGSDDEGHCLHRERSDEMALSPARDPGADDGVVAGMSLATSEEYRSALEALEAVRRHAFEVGAHRSEPPSAADDAPPAPDEPPDADGDLDDAASDDDGRSERGSSRRTLSMQIDGVWEVAARRQRLPAPAPLQRGFSIWSVLKNALGKDLTRITLPATINEPLSALQRIVEDLEYRHLLDSAAASRDPAERAALVAAFVASGYGSSLSRENKPFNPLLGETFEWQAADASCRFVCEQVSHHPPVSCWWSESVAGWRYWGELELRNKFWGKSVEMMPTGTCWLQLGDEMWSWNKANVSINNIIMGTIWLEWSGKINIHNHATGATTTLAFPKCGGHLEERGRVHCTVHDAGGKTAFALQGRFNDRLVAVPERSGAPERELFRMNPPPEHGSLQYSMTSLAMTLNTAEPELLRQLPPTDSRLRPDQRHLEDGDVEKATTEKMRLEEKQRNSRQARKVRGEPFLPAWFKLRSVSEKQREGADHWLGTQLVRLPGQLPPALWEFTDEYWDAKQRSDWARCPDLYSGGV